MTAPGSFVKSLNVVSESQKELLIALYENNQEHLFPKSVFDVATPPSTRRSVAQKLEQLDKSYQDGGLLGYLKNAKKLLADSKNGVNPLDGWKPSVPVGQLFEMNSPEYKETEKIGLEKLGNVGFVLVAGGLGERLGYSGIKVGLPTEMVTETCYLKFYIEYILAVQKKFGGRKKLPLCIMTSNDTNEKTIELLFSNNFFGMQKSQITIVQQGQGVPALTDNDARIAGEGSEMEIVCKPHGHGDIHELLYSKGVAKKWQGMGIEYLVLFQDTNGLAFHTLPLMLGVSEKLDLIMNSLTVPRKAKQAVGGITKLTNETTGETRTINVEYNQLDPLLRASGFKDGDVNDETTGYSPYPGNINQLLFKVKDYVEILERTKGLMPEFVNPKYADETKTKFKKPTRLECMMQDFPSVMNAEEGKRVGFTSISASYCFSPVKNATSDGVKLQENGTHPGTAASGEADQYAAHRKIMNSIGCNVETAKEEAFAGIKVHPGPAIVLKPSFVTYPGEYEEKFPFPTSISISARSTLIVRGSGVKIESLKLDGTLIVDFPDDEDFTVRDVVVENDGWVRVKDETSEDEVVKMRGYRIEKIAQQKLTTEKMCTIM